ncbi:MAG: hypothetical protein HQ568_11630 [Calditrichaeota bacterium]|nr:hypothetical protein [Calditrichota bacterium]
MKALLLFSFLAIQYLYLSIPGFAQPRIEVYPLEIWINSCLYNEIQTHQTEIRNTGDEILRWSIEVEFLDDDEAIFEIDRVEGVIEPRDDICFEVVFRDWEIAPGDHRANIHILSNDPENEDVIVTFLVNIRWPPLPPLVLERGWNLVSSPNEGTGGDRDIFQLFYDMIENRSLLMIKDGQGQFYSQYYNYNNIPFWDFHQGYYFKMAEADSFFIYGGPAVPPDTPIQLSSGWNLIAFFAQERVEAPVAFEGIEEVLIMAKDGDGNFYWPEYDFNCMPTLHLGEGYKVFVSEEVELIWNTR